MPRITYDGPHDGVDLVGVGTVARGESIDVPAALARELTGGDWSPEAKRKPRAIDTNTEKG